MSYIKEKAWFIQEGKRETRQPLGSTKHLHSKELSLSITSDIHKEMPDEQACVCGSSEEHKGLWLNSASSEEVCIEENRIVMEKEWPQDISTERLTHQNILMDSLGTLYSEALPIFFWTEREPDVINTACYTLLCSKIRT